eukprot:GHRQ01032548.1.p1 GENE.GHRQ01032548.1~~GHRQ01032548.1.p1  ORF type:complete len:144 (-),score=45.31 GHRQ01032548.1:308-739(-)
MELHSYLAISVLLLRCALTIVSCCMLAEDDLSSWECTRWWFNGHFFNSLDDLIRAWNADVEGMRTSFRMLLPAGAAKLYSNFLPRPGPKRGEKQPVGPLAFEPYGRRCGCQVLHNTQDAYNNPAPDVQQRCPVDETCSKKLQE